MTWRTGLARLCPRGQTAGWTAWAKAPETTAQSCHSGAMRVCPPYDSIHLRAQTTAPAAAVIHCSSFALGAAPTWREAISPFLKTIRVGIDITLYLAAVLGFSSTLSLTIFTLPERAPSASSSSAGAIIRHGPHHSAQKSTTTGSADLSTLASKSASRTFPTPIGPLLVLGISGASGAPRPCMGEGREA